MDAAAVLAANLHHRPAITEANILPVQPRSALRENDHGHARLHSVCVVGYRLPVRANIPKRRLVIEATYVL
jgi:hypothetical protein